MAPCCSVGSSWKIQGCQCSLPHFPSSLFPGVSLKLPRQSFLVPKPSFTRAVRARVATAPRRGLESRAGVQLFPLPEVQPLCLVFRFQVEVVALLGWILITDLSWKGGERKDVSCYLGTDRGLLTIGRVFIGLRVSPTASGYQTPPLDGTLCDQGLSAPAETCHGLGQHVWSPGGSAGTSPWAR